MFEFLEGTGIRRWIIQNGGLPFLMIGGNGKYTPNWQRLIEAMLIAGVTAFLASQLTIARLEVKIDYAKEDRARIQAQVTEHEKCLRDLIKEIAAIKK